MSLAFSVISLVDLPYLPFDWICHFRIEYLFAGFVGVIVFALYKKRNPVILSLLCIALNLPHIVPYYLPPHSSQAAPDRDTAITVMLINVRTANTKFEKIISLLDEEQPHLAVILEVDNTWVEKLSPISKRFPHSLVQARPDNFGISLFSSLPLENAKIVTFDETRVPSITADVRVEEKSFSLIATHAVPPGTPARFRSRNNHLRNISLFLKNRTAPVVVVGDLNTTMWSSHYKNFITSANLLNTRRGFGLLPTWPLYLPFALIPIDHILVSHPIDVLNTETRIIPGSDHLALISRIVVPSDKGL